MRRPAGAFFEPLVPKGHSYVAGVCQPPDKRVSNKKTNNRSTPPTGSGVSQFRLQAAVAASFSERMCYRSSAFQGGAGGRVDCNVHGPA